jgi:hypothetical protein
VHGSVRARRVRIEAARVDLESLRAGRRPRAPDDDWLGASPWCRPSEAGP